MSRIPAVVLLGTVAFGAFFAGRFSAPEKLRPVPVTTPPVTPAVETTATAPTSPSAPPAHTAAAGSETAPVVGDSRVPGTVGLPTRQPSPASASAAACPQELASLKELVAAEARHRAETDGTPIKPPASVPERFSAASLTAAVNSAFQQTKVPGRIETVDCAEHPCIVYGRIFGEEELLDRLERARALAPYRSDIEVALVWTSTDEALRRAGDDHNERALFAIAFYSKQEAATNGFEMDRRIRVRTAELWNALRPDDEG